ncbi:MAG: glycosyltransferase [Phycisphaerales bacterium]|nr:glycosyltransferase [Phycisphaerales bacterium]
MHIVHFFSHMILSYGGPVRAVLDLSAACAAAGHRVTILTLHDDDTPRPWRASEADDQHQRNLPRVIKFPGRAGPADWLTRPMRDLARSVLQDADCLHVHGMWMTGNHQLARLAERLGRPYLLSVRGMLDDWSMAQKSAKKRLFMALFARRTLERAGVVHCTAEGELTQARKWAPAARWTVIPNLLNLDEFRNLPGPDAARTRFPALAASHGPRLLFLSRVHPKKGCEVLIRALALLAPGHPGAVALFAGNADADYLAALRRLAAELNIADRVHFLGLVTGREKLSLYQASDLFVLPTSQENFGFVYFESLACGTPVLTTDLVDTWPELKASGGAVITPQDHRQVADAVARLWADPANLRAMGARGREWTLRELDTHAVLARFLDMYHALPRPRP